MRSHRNQTGWIRLLTVVFVSVALTMSSAITAFAENQDSCAPGSAAAGDPQAESGQADDGPPQIYVDGEPYLGQTIAEDGYLYVGIREFSLYMGAASVNWNGEAKTAVVHDEGLTLTAAGTGTYLEANGRFLWANGGYRIENGTLFASLRVLGKAFGCSVSEDADGTVNLARGADPLLPAEEFYDGEQLLWLSRIIHAEANTESLAGKMAVGSVVLNRVRDAAFPDTIYEVIFDMSAGVQFTPAATGTIYCSPSPESVLAAKLCLEGTRISNNIFFFVNEAIAENTWVSDNRPFIMVIGRHSFFA